MSALRDTAPRTDRVLRLVGACLLALSALTAVTSPATAQDGVAVADSSRTVTGSPSFPDLSVTVSKTRDLVNEVVQVSWTGVRPTRGNFAVDYLQIMQCWGDAASGPDREQCQFGGLTGDLRGGAFVASRQVTYDLVDPAETYRPTRPGQLRYVPFRSAGGKTTEAGLSEFFDASTTNEVPYGQTRADGAGTLPFEVQTSTEAPGLGCGVAGAPGSATATATTGTGAATTGLRCWLVVVPRGDREVDGSLRTEASSRQLLSSPLSQSNWAQRLTVPLDFTPVGRPCPLGKAERAVVGQEDAVEAVSSWQPALCVGDGPVYSYSQVADTLARRQVLGDSPGLSVTSRPLDPAQLPPGRTPSYAPVALAGLVVAFNIDSQSAFSAPAEVKARNGQRVTELNLTPRLVAKLLTQSYRVAAAQERPGLQNNPLDLTRDPEFLAVNPSFRQLNYTGIGGVVVPAGLSDSAGLVWSWLLSDADARAFLAGTPDPSGAVVNPAYKGTGAQDGFPKSDPVCTTFLTSQPPLCTLDAFPYAGDTHEGARGAARGDTLARSTFDSASQPPVYRRSLPQPTGARAVLSFTDTATARRYGLQVARLRNASGAFVAPDASGLAAGLAAMRPGAVPAVLEPAPASAAPGAYPLTSLSYAVTTAEGLDAAARTDYATFLRYAVGAGQQPGTGVGGLPDGYAPLPTALRQQTLAVAARLATVPASPAAAPAPAVAGVPDVVGGGFDSAPTTGSLPAPGPFGVPAPVSVPDQPGLTANAAPAGPAPAGAPVAAAATVATAVVRVAAPTPAQDAGAARYVLVLVLLAGGLSALAGSWLRRLGRTAG